MARNRLMGWVKIISKEGISLANDEKWVGLPRRCATRNDIFVDVKQRHANRSGYFRIFFDFFFEAVSESIGRYIQVVLCLKAKPEL